MTHKTTMPEPVAYFYQWDFDKYKASYPGGIPVITTDQAEAYATARVAAAIEAIAEAIGSDDNYLYDIVRGTE